MTRTKDMFEEVGTVKKIDTNGMAVFDQTLEGIDANKKKVKKTVESRLLAKCEKGDKVLRFKNSKKFVVIPTKEWADMPATEEEANENNADKSTPQLSKLAAQNKEIAAQNAELLAQNADLKARVEALEAKGGKQ